MSIFPPAGTDAVVDALVRMDHETYESVIRCSQKRRALHLGSSIAAAPPEPILKQAAMHWEADSGGDTPSQRPGFP